MSIDLQQEFNPEKRGGNFGGQVNQAADKAFGSQAHAILDNLPVIELGQLSRLAKQGIIQFSNEGTLENFLQTTGDPSQPHKLAERPIGETKTIKTPGDPSVLGLPTGQEDLEKAPTGAPLSAKDQGTFTEVKPEDFGLTFEDLDRAGGEGAVIEQGGKSFVITPLGTLRPVEEAVREGAVPDVRGAPAPGVPAKQTPEEIIKTRPPDATDPASPPVPPTPPTGGQQEADSTAIISDINKKANADQGTDAQIIEDSGIRVRTSTNLIGKLEDLFTTERPKPPSLEDTFAQKREELGIEPLETDLARIDADIDRINTNLLVEAEKAGERLVPVAQIGRRRGKLQQEAEQRIALLNVERSAVARQLDNKINTLNTVMNLTQQDFANATTQYNQQFSQAVQIINLIQGQENFEANQAQANLNTIVNMASNAGKSWNDLTSDMQRNVQNLELQSGLPVGSMQSFMINKPNTEILSTTTGRDAQGNDIVTFIYKDPVTGKPGVVETVKTGGVKEDKKTSFDDAVSFVNDSPDATDEELKLELLANGYSSTDANAVIAAREKTALTAEEAKAKVIETLTPVKGSFTRSEAETMATTQLKEALGIGKGEDLPKAYEDAIKDALVEVYGKTFFQSILPGGR